MISILYVQVNYQGLTLFPIYIDYFLKRKLLLILIALAINHQCHKSKSILVGIWAGTKSVIHIVPRVQITSAILIPLTSIAVRRIKVRRGPRARQVNSNIKRLILEPMLHLHYKLFFYNLKYFPTTNFDKEANNTVSNY